MLGCFDWFYPLYRSFHENRQEGLDALSTYVDGNSLLSDLVYSLAGTLPGKSFQSVAEELLERTKILTAGRPPGRGAGSDVTPALRAAATDPQLRDEERLRFFTAAVIIKTSIDSDSDRNPS
jgi:hypothetical protein